MRRRQDSQIILIDFGAVREINQLIVNVNGNVTTTVAIGTPGYAPSEQAKGRPKLCSDVYAVGMVGIQALTGIPPHQLQEDPNTGEVIWRHLVRKINPKFADVLERMVRDHFSQRYQNAGEALQAILSFSQPAPPPPPPPPPTIISTNTTRRVFLQFAGFAGGGLALALLSQNLLNNKSSAPAPSLSPSSDNKPPAELPPPPESLPEIPSPQPQANGLKKFNFETVTVNSTGKIANRRQGQARFFTENIGNGITLDMVAIPGGSFVMGSPNTEAQRTNDEGPQRTVNISPFFMGKYEVTQEQYQAVMGNNPSNFKGAKRPVEKVSWNDAVEFCRKLFQKTGKTYRLPSEAEWEYACRTGTSTPFYFGDTITPDLVNYNGNNFYGSAPKGFYRQQTTDVGTFPPNSFGLYDMHGNVWEWCADPWHANYQGAPSDGRVWDEISNDNRYQNYDLLLNIKNDNRTRLLRGGSWYFYPGICRSAIRGVNFTPDVNGIIGFRVVCVAASAP